MCNYYISKTATAEPGADSVLVDRHVTCSASLATLSGQRCCKLRLKLLAKKTRYSCSSSSSLQRGWSARMATRWSTHHPACSIRYRSPHVSSSANDSFKKFTGARSRHHPPFILKFARSLRQNRRLSFCSGRGENLVTIARFGKPLFANMHHHVHAVAGALRKPNVAYPHPDVSAGWPVTWSTLSSHSAAASDSVLTFRRPNGFFLHLHQFLR